MKKNRFLHESLLAISLAAVGCGAANEEIAVTPPPAAPAVSLEVTSATTAAPPAADTQPVKVDPSILSTTDPAGYTKKDLENIIQHLDWHAENYISQMNKIPTIEELKAWRDPNYRLGLPEWPKPPAGKKWVMNEKSGQFSLADVTAP